MAAVQEASPSPEFGRILEGARVAAGLSSRQLAKTSGVAPRRITELEEGRSAPTERELGVLAQACRISVFDLLPSGYSLRVLAHDTTSGAHEVSGTDALDALLREYLSMVIELRSGRAVTPPTLRHEDLVELATALGDSPDAIERRLLELLGTDVVHAEATRAMILPSTADD
jgi:transcriptional regulator with XRE-family HTH domain